MVGNINSPVLPCNGKKMCKCGITGHFARVCRGGTRRQAGQQQFNFVSEDTNEGAFVTECDTTPQFARKYSANLHLIHGEKTKVVKAQIDSACSCNTIPSGLLRNLFPGAEIHRTSSKINTYGNETMRPEGQVTLKGQDSHHRFPCGKRSRWECRCTILNL